MIRLIKRQLIIPRGDTGTFSIPRLAQEPEDGSKTYIFTIFSPMEHKKIFEKAMQPSDGMLKIEFTHMETVNLPVGEFVWDIKLYVNAVVVNDVLISGEEIDSYYAAFKLPVCEIRQTGDALLVSDEAPTATINPEHLNVLETAITAAREANNSAQATLEQLQALAAELEEKVNELKTNSWIVESYFPGETISIVAQPNVRYICDTVETMSITPCNGGRSEFIFTSGEVATQLTVYGQVKWPVNFDPANLESNHIYNIIITNGNLGTVLSWQL